MSVNRCILNNYMFGNSNPVRGKVPNRFDTSGYHLFCRTLSFVYRDGQYSYLYTQLFLLLSELRQGIYRNMINEGSCQLGFDIEPGNDFETVLRQSRILHERGPQTSNSENECFVHRRESEKFFQYCD